MLQFKNHTPFEGKLLLLPDPAGIDSLYTVIKGTFVLSENPAPAEKQLPVALKDEYIGEPGQSSLKVASDVGLVKPGTDVLLLGAAYAPAGKPVAEMDVTVTIGPVNKSVRVIGDRVWESGLFGARRSAPQPFETMPLVWERAFGGADQVSGDPPMLHAESRNPVGAGFRHPSGEKKLEGMKLPNLEDPKQLISSWKDRPAPASFGPLCPHWEPRRTHAGTYDEAWQKKRAPYLPSDFDPRFFQLAPPDLVAKDYLTGDESAEVLGASPSGALRFRLPACRLQATYRLDDQANVMPMNLDTVVIEPDVQRLVLVWRTVFPCDKKVLRVREVEASFASTAEEG